MGKFRSTHFVRREITNPQNQHFGVQEICTELCGTVVVWITVRFPTFFLETEWVKTLQ